VRKPTSEQASRHQKSHITGNKGQPHSQCDKRPITEPSDDVSNRTSQPSSSLLNDGNAILIITKPLFDGRCFVLRKTNA
jgi:hypothetical protein